MLGLVEPSGCRLSREELTNYMSLLCRSNYNCLLFKRFLTLILLMIIIGLEDLVLSKIQLHYVALLSLYNLALNYVLIRVHS